MVSITILGLGPGNSNKLTQEALAILNSRDEIWLRTRHHPMVQELPGHLAIRSFDEWYEEASDFDTLYRRIAEEVVRLGRRREGVLYGVPGHPWVGESTVSRIVQLARQEKLPVEIVDGLSFIEPSLAAVQADALDGLQIVDATEVANHYYPPLNGDRPHLVGQLHSRMVASDLKLVLMEMFPDDHPVTLISEAGMEGVALRTIPLHDLDHHSHFSDRTTLWIPSQQNPSSLPYFLNIVAHLRSPEGCPWDRKQDYRSLRRFVLEEAYEVAEAIDRESATELRDELGDLLLMITMLAQIASESGEFNMSEIIRGVADKMIRRHPHVFGSTEVSSADEVVQNWEEIKAREKKQDEARAEDPFDEVPLALPALARAQKIAKRARQQGWQAPDPAKAFAAYQKAPEDDVALSTLLLALAARASQNKQDAEELLRQAAAQLINERRDTLRE